MSVPPRTRSLKLGGFWRMGLYVITGGVWLSGAVWLVAHYFMREKGPFGFKTNPLEIWSLTVHGGFAVGCVFLFGWLWNHHVVGGWTMRWRRRSGGTIAGATIWLTLTGYALYYIGSEDWLNWIAILHWAIGLAALGAFLVHRLSKTAPRVPPRPTHRVRGPSRPF